MPKPKAGSGQVVNKVGGAGLRHTDLAWIRRKKALHALALGIERIGSVSLRFPMAVAFVVIALAIAAGFGVARIKVDDSLSQLFRSDTPEFKQYEEVTRRFPSSEFDVLVVIEGKTLLARVLRVIGRRPCRLSRRPGQSRRIQTLGPLDGWDLVGACGGYQWRRHVHCGAATGDSPSCATFPYAAHQPELFGSTHLWSSRKARRCFGCHIDRQLCT